MNNLWSKRIPTLFGLIAIVVGIALTSFLTRQGAIFTGKASPTDVPENVSITNIFDTSFTVSYTTTDSVIGSINFGENSSLGTIALDTRDKSPITHTSHYIEVKNLKPETIYYFSIISGQNTYLNKGSFYSVKTGNLLNPSDSFQKGTVSGKAILPDGSSASETLVFLDIAGAQKLSAITKPNGDYQIKLNLIRTTDLSSYYSIDNNSLLSLVLIKDSVSSKAKLTLDQASFVPTITLSKNYDFTSGNNPIEISETATPSAKTVFPTATPSAKTNSSPEILTPSENQSFSDEKPLFKGKALPNETVEITIHSDQVINTSIKSDSNGNWSYRPDDSLTPGEHTISITTKDAFGILKTITKQFTVYASGSQVSESATPSATLTPSVTITPTVTVTEIPITTVTPIATQAPTTIITETPMLTEVLPPTGTSSAQTLGIFGIALLILGTLLFILTRVRI